MGLLRRVELKEESSPPEKMERAVWFVTAINTRVLPPQKKKHRWVGEASIITDPQDPNAVETEVVLTGGKDSIPNMNALEPLFKEKAELYWGVQTYFAASEYFHGPDVIQRHGYGALDRKYGGNKAVLLAIYRFNG